MMLPAFIARSLEFFGKAESNFTAEAKAQKAEARVKELEIALATATERVAELEAKVTTLETAASDFTVQITKATADLAETKAALETEKRKTIDTLAQQGIPPDLLPANTPNPKPGAAVEEDESNLNLTEQCKRAAAKKLKK